MHLRWPGRRRTLHEQLLEQGARDVTDAAEPPAADTTPAPEPRRGRAVSAGVALAVVAVSLVVHLAPSWLQALVAAPVVAYSLVTAVRSRKTRPRPRMRLARVLFLVALAVSVAVTVLVAISGYYGRGELVLLAVAWAIVGVLWLSDRWLHPGPTPG
jgi:hypothetical protein